MATSAKRGPGDDPEQDWRQRWIGRPGALLLDGDEAEAAAYLRKVFVRRESWRKATIRVCGVGFCELFLNGEKVGDHVLDPAFTDYSKRLRYLVYDVSSQLRQGENVVGAILGNGWYNSPWNLWRSYPRMALQLELDGVPAVRTGPDWRTTTGPIVFNGIRNGEFYDARRELGDWLAPGYDDGTWPAAERCMPPGGVFEEQTMPPCRVMETLPPQTTTPLPDGSCVYDFGVNVAGWCRLRVCGARGTVVTLRYAERVAPTGEVDQAHIGIFLRSGEVQTDRYTLKGEGLETWEPRFTYHGFQYCQVSLAGEGEVLGLEARVVHTAFASAGRFQCSDETLNRLQACFRRSYVGNFVGMPTDCPHREKCGWTGDAWLAAEAGLLNYAAAPAYAHWLANFPDIQRPNGQMHGVIPYCEGVLAWESGPPWDAALILLPWLLYVYSGDLEPARRLYPAMKRYLDFCAGQAEDQIVAFGLDDWCHPQSPNEHPWKERHDSRKAPLAMLATAYYYSACRTFARIAGLTGQSADCQAYAGRADAIRRAFNQRFYHGEGLYANGCQTALGCALYHELAEPEAVPLVARQLHETVRANGYKVDFGILGSKYVLRALAEHGYAEAAYRLLTQPECPGYAHWLTLGATTLFEQWDGSKSRNHVCFGDFSAWLYRYLAGLAPDPESPGFRHILIRPRPVSGVAWVEVEHQCTLGRIKVAWRQRDEAFSLAAAIPDGATASIELPDGSVHRRGAGEHTFETSTNQQ